MDSFIAPKPTGFALAYLESMKLLGQLQPAKVPNTNFERLYAAIEQHEVRTAGTVAPPRRKRAK